MPKKKPMIDATVLDILQVTVDAASTQPATVALEIEGQANVSSACQWMCLPSSRRCSQRRVSSKPDTN